MGLNELNQRVLSKALGPLEGGGAATASVQPSLAFPRLPCLRNLSSASPPPVNSLLRGKEACYWGAWPLANRGPSSDTRSHWLTADCSKIKKGARGTEVGVQGRLPGFSTATPPHPDAREPAGTAGRPAGVYNPAFGALPAAGEAGSGLGSRATRRRAPGRACNAGVGGRAAASPSRGAQSWRSFLARLQDPANGHGSGVLPSTSASGLGMLRSVRGPRQARLLGPFPNPRSHSGPGTGCEGGLVGTPQEGLAGPGRAGKGGGLQPGLAWPPARVRVQTTDARPGAPNAQRGDLGGWDRGPAAARTEERAWPGAARSGFPSAPPSARAAAWVLAPGGWICGSRARSGSCLDPPGPPAPPRPGVPFPAAHSSQLPARRL